MARVANSGWLGVVRLCSGALCLERGIKNIPPSAADQGCDLTPKRYLNIYAALWKNSVVREMGFKTNFIMWIIVELLGLRCN